MLKLTDASSLTRHRYLWLGRGRTGCSDGGDGTGRVGDGGGDTDLASARGHEGGDGGGGGSGGGGHSGGGAVAAADAVAAVAAGTVAVTADDCLTRSRDKTG